MVFRLISFTNNAVLTCMNHSRPAICFGRLLNNCVANVCKYSTAQTCNVVQRSLGQPTAYTHPYLMKDGDVTPGLKKEDYASRRVSLMTSLKNASAQSWLEGKDNVVIMFGEAITYMSEDIPYPFHQNTNFRYLTGFLEPGSCLIMSSTHDDSLSHETTLLVPDRDPSKELWHGPRAGIDGALDLTGVDKTLPIDEFPQIVNKFIDDKYVIWYDFQKPVNMTMHMQHMRPLLTEVFNKKQKINSVSSVIHKLRHIKSDKEVLLMMKAANITAEAFKRAIPASYPDIDEGVINAMIDCECRFGGAQMLAYPPVVAGGPRANILHYISNNQRISDGQLVLVDAGAEYHGYVADVTRTWPISGKFTPAQRVVYEIVLNIQVICIKLCRPGISLDQIHATMVSMLVQHLVSSGIIKEKPNQDEVMMTAMKYCPHHVGHWLGMDVHDTASVPRSVLLAPGMVVTVEPGIYIREDDVNVAEEFRGIAIRIEDDVAVTSGDPVVLSAGCPKHIDDIEGLITSS